MFQNFKYIIVIIQYIPDSKHQNQQNLVYCFD